MIRAAFCYLLVLVLAPTLALALALAPIGDAWGEPTIGILPVVGPSSIAERLNPALGRAVAEAGQHAVLGPVEVQARLAGAPGVQLALRDAQESILLAEQQELQMNRTAAVAAARKAIALLRSTRAAYHQPRLLARGKMALALALLLDPADRTAARQAFREAFVADPHYQPDLDRIPPKNVELLQQAVQQGVEQQESSMPLPATTELADLAARTGLRKLVWIGVSQKGESDPTVQVLVYNSQTEKLKQESRREVRPDRLLARTAELVVQALGGPPTQGPSIRSDLHLAAGDRLQPPVPSQGSESTPWYRRWWVWSLAGAVLVGAGVSTAIVLMRDEDQPGSRYDYHFHF